MIFCFLLPQSSAGFLGLGGAVFLIGLSRGGQSRGSNECCWLRSSFDAKNHGVKQSALLIAIL